MIHHKGTKGTKGNSKNDVIKFFKYLLRALCAFVVNSPDLLFLLVGSVVIASTLADYGMGWDEAVHSRYAELVIGYFASLGADTSCNRYYNLKEYGPGADLLAALLYRPWPRWQVEVRHAVAAALGLLTVPAVIRFGRTLGTPRAGAIGGVALLMMSQFYGQAFINTKDIPFACAFAWSMASLAGLLTRGTYRWREVIACGLAMGLAAAVRPGGVILLGLVSATAIGHGWIAGRRVGSIGRWLAMAGLAWAVMVAAWPWALGNVVLHPLGAIGRATGFDFVYPVVFEGRTYASNRLPWHYLVETIAITTPVPILALALLGLLVGVRRLVRDPRGPAAPALVIASAWPILPLALWTMARPNIYDGMRHFLFILPAIALWAGIGGHTLIASAPGRLRPAMAVAVAVAILWSAPALVRLHPYQMAYHNELVGGMRGADGRFETDYWVTSYREAMAWINAQARGRPVRVAVAANGFSIPCASRYSAPGVTVEPWMDYAGLPGRLRSPYDYYLVTTRAHLDRISFPGSPVAKTIGRDGAVFAVVRRR